MGRTRARSNSFRGKEMHDSLLGQQEIVNDLLSLAPPGGCSTAGGSGSGNSGSGSSSSARTGAGGAGGSPAVVAVHGIDGSGGDGSGDVPQISVSCDDGGGRGHGMSHQRRDSVAPKPKEGQLSIRQEVRRRSMDCSSGSYDVPERLSVGDVREFQELVKQYLDVNKADIEVFREDPLVAGERQLLEERAIQYFFYFEQKEEAKEKLTVPEFELKCMVDDVLVKLLHKT